jgi:hypothetical protein
VKDIRGLILSDSIANRFEVVNCQACGRRVARKSRQHRYCSDRCRDYEKGQRRVRKSFLSTDTRASPNPLFLSNKNNELRGPKSGSSIPLNVLGGYRWSNAIPVDRDVLRKVVWAELAAHSGDNFRSHFRRTAKSP